MVFQRFTDAVFAEKRGGDAILPQGDLISGHTVTKPAQYEPDLLLLENAVPELPPPPLLTNDEAHREHEHQHRNHNHQQLHQNGRVPDALALLDAHESSMHVNSINNSAPAAAAVQMEGGSFDAEDALTVLDVYESSNVPARDGFEAVDDELMSELMQELGTLASVMYCHAKEFVMTGEGGKKTEAEGAMEDGGETIGGDTAVVMGGEVELINLGDGVQIEVPQITSTNAEALLVDDLLLLDVNDGISALPQANHREQPEREPGVPAPFDDDLLFGTLPSEPQQPVPWEAQGGLAVTNANVEDATEQMVLLLSESEGRGLRVSACVRRRESDGELYYMFKFENRGLLGEKEAGLSEFGVQLNRNAAGLVMDGELMMDQDSIAVGECARGAVRVRTDASNAAPAKGALVQVAIRCRPLGVLYTKDSLENLLDLLFDPPQPDAQRPSALYARIAHAAAKDSTTVSLASESVSTSVTEEHARRKLAGAHVSSELVRELDDGEKASLAARADVAAACSLGTLEFAVLIKLQQNEKEDNALISVNAVSDGRSLDALCKSVARCIARVITT
uniref:Uncharacterized protein n=1 Tax=Erythrolobus madagascarensis TaxID=708628 RepID=A0A7S0T5U0_9RHOD